MKENRICRASTSAPAFSRCCSHWYQSTPMPPGDHYDLSGLHRRALDNLDSDLGDWCVFRRELLARGATQLLHHCWLCPWWSYVIAGAYPNVQKQQHLVFPFIPLRKGHSADFLPPDDGPPAVRRCANQK